MFAPRNLLPFLAFACLAAGGAVGREFPAKVENFALLDHRGKHHELDYYLDDPKVRGIVLFIQGNGCPLVRKRIPDLKRLRDRYQSRGVLFAMLNANPQDEREDLTEEAEAYKIDMPILKDGTQLVVQMLGVDRTAEALLIDGRTSTIAYRGPVDDRLSYQSEKPKASHRYLEDAIRALLGEGELPATAVEAPGCRITMEHAKVTGIDYSRDVAPILKQRCVSCHTKGGVAPFSMSSFKKVRGWSEMIEEVILTRQMPPWHADPHIGAFSNASDLTDAEASTIVQWIRNGCERGEGNDPLDGYAPPLPTWNLGTPDAILDLPKQEVPAEGILEYRYVYLDSPFDRDVWLHAAEVSPGNRRVLHHAIVTAQPRTAKRTRSVSGKWITGYAPGAEPFACPKGSGVLLPKGHVIKVELHYTVSGRTESDQTRLGLYLLDAPPPKELKTGVIAHGKFAIPPHAPEHRESHAQKISKDILIYSINPHMHFRGKWMNFALRAPSGEETPLLSVPDYNFNWQRTYEFSEPRRAAAGSTLIIRNAWDNSARNPHNPDPTKTVKWGDQSSDEMFFATFTYIEEGE